MVTLIAQAILGLAAIWLIVASNRQVFRRAPSGPLLSGMECAYYVIGIVSVVLAWYFNIRYVSQYSAGLKLWASGGWTQYAKLMFGNHAASSTSQDYLIANLVLLPLFTMVDGSRRGVRRPWLYFVASWFLSFAFAWAFYLATIDRQRRIAAHTTWE
ncbi:DUF2834 domain-containing protein [Mycobacterium gastri]|uniref:DUF2834 domain-containing protein n=1 Tax=Mycobacterium gastri TaxID=1777 RepID=A0A1X1UX41_MYCGS|nr:DUF2834 domain-containing protein [Mycobacterium gastri]ETW26585.1 hypothetical protein MGAST_11015 [Mycobacterium gastri 'Wayne']ORV61393.1 hypothetical protein AWC07_17435 [Mycobacterium gastri]